MRIDPLVALSASRHPTKERKRELRGLPESKRVFPWARAIALSLLGCAHALPAAALAQDYPSRPIRLIVPFVRVPAHGGHDSGLMADSVPASWRTAFRFDGGHFLGRFGMVSAMIPERLGR